VELPTVVIDGAKCPKPGSKITTLSRYRVVIDGGDVLLQAAMFRITVILALARQNENGWVYLEEFYADQPTARKYIDRTRKQILDQVDEDLWDWPVIHNDRRGHYRLATTPDKISFSNPLALSEFGDATIRQMMEGMV